MFDRFPYVARYRNNSDIQHQIPASSKIVYNAVKPNIVLKP